MPSCDLFEYLRKNRYPGRGIIMGRSAQENYSIAAYFIMGRSESSRNRVFAERKDAVITQAADPGKMDDPSLLIYTAMRRHGPHLIVGNGDQTETVYSCLQRDITFEEALRTRTFEPDAPNYTPRITALLSNEFSGFAYRMSIIKSTDGNPDSVQRLFFEYPQPLAGQGHLLHTYQGDGHPLPSFCGEPWLFIWEGQAEEFGKRLWNSLDEDNKISLVVRIVSLDGTEETRVFNKYNSAEYA